MLEPTAVYRVAFADYLPRGSLFLLIEPEELQDEGCCLPGTAGASAGRTRRALRSGARTAVSLGDRVGHRGQFPGDHLPAEDRVGRAVQRLAISKVREELEEAGTGQEVFVVCQTAAEAKRLSDLFGGTRLAAAGKLHFPLGNIPRKGFRLVPDATAVAPPSGELFNREDLRWPGACGGG